MQKMKLWDVRILDEQVRCAIESNREVLAKLALERKNTNLLKAQGVDKQITEIESGQQKLEDTEKSLYTKVEEFKSKKELIGAIFCSGSASTDQRKSHRNLRNGERWHGYEQNSR